MTVISVKRGIGAEFRRIELSDGSFFSFKTCYLPPVFVDEDLYTPGTAEGRDLGAAEEAAFRFASACLRAEKAALNLITRAEQCVFGLSRKLEKRGHETACVQTVVSRLVDLQLLDDSRFARLWLESRLRLTRTPRRLLSGLYGRGIDRDDAGKALKSVLDEEAEYALLARFAAKQRRLKTEDNARSLKFTLKNEGFSSTVIQRFFEEQEGQ